MKGSIRFLISLLFFFGLALVTNTVFAQSGQPISDDQVNDVAMGLYCPVCENIPLDVCPTRACAQWRELIRDKLSLGWSKTQIEDYFVQQYGDRVLAVPPKTGINRMIYVIPPVVVIVGVVLTIVLIKQGKKPAPAAATEKTLKQDDVPNEYLKKIEQDMKKDDES